MLHEGKSVRTGIDGLVDIKFSDGTAVRISEESYLNLDDISIKTVSMTLEEGTLISKFKKLFSDQDFSVKTPSVTAGIRGTELIITTDSNSTEMVGMSGLTEIFNPLFPEKKVLLGFQVKSSIPADRPPGDPVQLTPEEVSEYRNMIESINTNMVLMLTEPVQFKPDSAEIVETSHLPSWINWPSPSNAGHIKLK